MNRVVAIPVIRGVLKRGTRISTEIPYAEFGLATWRWWCRQKGVELEVFTQPMGGPEFEDLPPTMQRWHIPRMLFEKYGPNTRVLMVDADTMIRWTTPDIFSISPSGLAGVFNRAGSWNARCVHGFSEKFPEFKSTRIDSVMNCGLVMMGPEHLPLVDAFLQLVRDRKADFLAVLNSDYDSGTDQLPFNWLMQQRKEKVTSLPMKWNHVGCMRLCPSIATRVHGARHGDEVFPDVLRCPTAFKFIDGGSYIWHFNHFAKIRLHSMAETWRRIQHHYSGQAVAGVG